MVAKFEDRLVEQLRELAITKGMIERLDEIVSIKANKTTVDDLVFRMRKLATIEMLKQSEDSYDG